MDNDEDIIKTDDTLYSSPIGKYKSYKVPYVDNYIDPKLYFKKALDPLRNFQGYDRKLKFFFKFRKFFNSYRKMWNLVSLKVFRQISSLVKCIVNALLSRNFCQKNV